MDGHFRFHVTWTELETDPETITDYCYLIRKIKPSFIKRKKTYHFINRIKY